MDMRKFLRLLGCVVLLSFVTEASAMTYWCQKDPDADGIPTYSSGQQGSFGGCPTFGSNCCPQGYSNPTATPDYWPGDNCPAINNPDQLDADGDKIGDACDTDNDNDGIPDASDPDDDNDVVLDVNDNCPLNANADQLDTDGDGIGNACDTDKDGDGVPDVSDKFPLNAAAAVDHDNDGLPDSWIQPNPYSCAPEAPTCNGLTLDMDYDNDGVLDASDNCPQLNNPDQLDEDNDGVGNACDSDSAGKLDTAFNPAFGPDDGVFAVAVQPDGKVLIGGWFGNVNNMVRYGIARLNRDGSLDAGFNPAISGSGYVFALAVQPDGKIMIGGLFDTVNGVARSNLARLNSDGSLDTSFNTSGTDGTVNALVVQPDGKVVVGGQFTMVNSVGHNYIARMNSNGSLDNGFSANTSSVISALVLQPDGKLVIGGKFTSVNGIARNYVARLEVNGSLDKSLNPGSGPDGFVYALALQEDGKLIVGGDFFNVNGVSHSRIARFNSGGILDSTFNGNLNSSVNALFFQRDGKIVTGVAASLGDVKRFNPDGSPDSNFYPGAGARSNVRAIAAQPDGKLVIAGDFTLYDGTSINRIAQIHTGDVDQDGIEDASDNCPSLPNADQMNADGDAKGDVCDAFPFDSSESVDTDGDGIGNNADNDDDNDGVVDLDDAFPLDASETVDTDGDGIGNNADTDDDNDGVPDSIDMFPLDPLLLLRQDGAAKSEWLGSSVAMADMNNDGVVDMLVGSPAANVSIGGVVLKKAGMIRIISGMDNSVLYTINGSAPNEQLGAAIAVVPDQNADGVPDIIVGDPLADVTTLTPTSFPVLKDAGRVLLYSGSDGRMLRILGEGKNAGDHFGAAVAAADVNGDNKVDVVVGAPRADVSAKDAGQVTVFDGLGKKILYQRNGEQAGENFGAALAAANNHLFVGSRLFDATSMKDVGRVVVFNSSEGDSAALLTVSGAASGDAFGSAITAANDTWAVGVPLADSQGKDAGSVLFYSGLDATPVATLSGAAAGDNFGSALNMQGDMNKDGINDIAIGAAKFDVHTTINSKAVLLRDSGRVEVISGAVAN